MNKNSYIFAYLVLASLLIPSPSFAYYMSMDIGPAGVVSYSYPEVLGDDDNKAEKKEEKREDKKEEKVEVKKEEKREERREENKEVKPNKVEQRPEKIEIKKVENKAKVKLIKQNKVTQELSPEKVSLKFPAVPRLTLTPSPKEEDRLDEVETENENEIENENENEVENQNNNEILKRQKEEEKLRQTIKERLERRDEKVEIQSETRDDGTVEMQLESRDIKAKIKNNEIELDVKNNSIGSSSGNSGEKRLIHLPDQAMQRFIDKGMSTVPDTLEVGESGDSFEYSINATKKEKLFGLIPRLAKYKLTLDDQNGVVSEQEVNTNIVDRLLNIFSF